MGTSFSLVEDRLLDILKIWVEKAKNEWEEHRTPDDSDIDAAIKVKQNMVRSLEKSISDLQQQSGNPHDLLERGVYTVDTFLERSKTWLNVRLRPKNS